MRVFWQILFLYLGATYLVRLCGVAFDGWELDRWETGFACLFTVFFAAGAIVREGESNG